MLSEVKGFNAVTHPVGTALIDLKQIVHFKDLVPHRLNLSARPANCFYPGDCCIRSNVSG